MRRMHAPPRGRAAWLVAALLVVTSSAAGQNPAGRAPVKAGIDVLIEENFAPLRGQRVGLITNPTGVTRDLRSTVDVLHKAAGVELVKLFGPEHGVRGDIYAGGAVADDRDPTTELPVHSLYGKTRKATPEMLAGLDALVFDIQDIGSRSYTYISTLALAMEAAAEQGVAVVVLDRPNPLGGERVEGRPLDLEFQSFVGHLPVPYCHGMTVGELARMANGEGWLAGGARCELTVVPMQGWKRDMLFGDTDLHWVPTSPHVPRADTSFFYAATGIMGELRVISEGVGYTLPFELAGRPGLEPAKLAEALNGRGVPGVIFRPLVYRPFYGPFEGQTLGGVQVVLADARRAPLTEVQFHIMDVVKQQQSDVKLFGSRRDAMFDKVCGTDRIRKLMQEDRPLNEVLAEWRRGVEEFRAQRAKYLLYE